MEKETDRSGIFEPKLDYAPNEMFPCFADVLKIENNHQHGRHVVAKEDIDVGKTVMVDQSYFAETFNLKYRRCGIFFREVENLKPCNKCTFTMFCPRCEGNSFHDIECDVNPTYFGCLSFASFRMVIIRSILLAMNAFDDIDQLIAAVEEILSSDAVEAPESLSDPQSKYRAFFKLQPNSKENVDEKLPQKIYLIYRLLIGQSKVSKIFHSEASKRFLMHLFGHHVIVIKNWIRSDRYKTGRKGLFNEDIEVYYEHRISITASYFNHSCSPNAYITAQNGLNIAVVLRPVRKNEQLCVTYDEQILMKPKTERQRDLQSKFKFQCKCDRCKQPQLESSTLNSNLRIKLDPIFQSIFESRSVHDYQTFLSLKANAFGLLKKYKKVAWSAEVYRIIYSLYTLALMETETATAGSMPFTGHIFNITFD
ncbi:SET and MYND domain-containing protein DDB_G0273589-like [Sitodiplosis mosellana]|uniref:SET and MYND domain-containing protein DDB_G0273589-like n=1 Tax=Sitodiplosis mosellana TaxID=263140 RepID=UPI002444F4A5|nr:SET and MYND domain-containing protein DDB_G0273589-like [Sitodiplosis mosellana]